MQISSDAFAWLAEHGIVKNKTGKGGAKGTANTQTLPAHTTAGLVSGELFIKLINEALAKHGVKKALAASKAGDRYETWSQVAKGVRRFAVELDEETIQALADGDAALISELLGELCLVYHNWAANEAKKRKRRQRDRRAQPQQGGYGARASIVSNSPAVSQNPGAPLDSYRNDSEAAGTPLGENYGEAVVHDAQADPGEEGGEYSTTVADPAYVASSPASQHPAYVASSPASQQPVEPGHSPADRAYAPVAEPQSSRYDVPASVTASQENIDAVASNAEAPGDVVAHQHPAKHAAAAQGELPTLSIDQFLQRLSPDIALEEAASAPELLGLSMLSGLRISASQARTLLADDARRLSRAFGETNERNAKHMERWLRSLMYYCGALAELLLLHPAHTHLVLGAVQHGLRAVSAAVAEAACQVLAGICAGLAGGRLRSTSATWLVESSALRDIMALLVGPVACPETREAAALLVFNCCQHDLMLLLAQHLKQVSKGEQEYLSAVHFLLLSFLKRPEAADLCIEQGVLSHFLARCVQRLGDDRSTAGTQQAAALFASELWLSSMELKGVQVVAPEGPGELLAALKRASQSATWPTLRLVAFSCLSRLLGTLCRRRDPENTPAVYRTFVYALVEAEGAGVRDFAVRNLMELMKQHAGVPVGILVEPMMKKFQATHQEVLSVIDIELFLVIAKHPRCTGKHAEMLAQVLARACVENTQFGRAATLPLLAILHRFVDDESIALFFERFLQIVLTRLIQRGTPKAQTTQILEVLAKIACLQSPQLEQKMRGMMLEISKAYLLSFESLHPNLQALLELWPTDQAAVDDWARSQFVVERPLSHQGPSNDPMGNLVLRSVSPSVKSEPPRTPAKQHMPGAEHVADAEFAKPAVAADLPEESKGSGLADASTPAEVNAEVEKTPGSDSGLGNIDDEDADATSPVAASDTAGVGDDSRVEQFVRETEQLRQELEAARERQQKANEEAEGLRRELDEAQRVHKHIEGEVEQLQQRRDHLVQKRDAAPKDRSKDRGRGRKPGEKDASGADSEKAVSLLVAFKEPLHIIFTVYARTKRSRGPAHETLAVQLLEQLFIDMEVVPGRIAKKALLEALRATRPRDFNEPLHEEDFIALLQRIAGLAFRSREATCFESFGVPVPTGDDPAAQLEVQAMLQHVARLAVSSTVAGLQAARPAFDVAVQRWVINYAQGVLDDLNSRLEKGEELKDEDVPEGFEIQLKTPPLLYTVPDELPIPESEKHCAEILDEILASALELHFLEPASSASGPVPKVVVRGHEDISQLIVEQPSLINQQRVAQLDREQPKAVGRAVPKAGGSARRHSSPRPDPPQLPLPVQTEQHQPAKHAQRGRRPRNSGRRKRETPREQKRAAAEVPSRQTVPAEPQQAERTEPRRRSRESQERKRVNQTNNRQQPRESSTGPASSPARREQQQQQPRRQAAAPAPKAPPAPSPPPPRRPAPSPPPQSRPVPSPQPRRQEPAPSAKQPSSSPPPQAPSPSNAVAQQQAGRRNNVARQHSTVAQQVKERQEAIQATLQSPQVQAILKSMGTSLQRTFEFFARWKGGNDGSMQMAGFLKLGECFGLLNNNMLKVIFRHVGGTGLASEVFPEALFLCAVRAVELGIGDAKISLDEEQPRWLNAFRDLCKHMHLADASLLRKILDSYRRTGDTLPEFHIEAPSTLAVQPAAAAPESLTGVPDPPHAKAELQDELQATQLPAANPLAPEAAAAAGTVMTEAAEDKPLESAKETTADGSAPADSVNAEATSVETRPLKSGTTGLAAAESPLAPVATEATAAEPPLEAATTEAVAAEPATDATSPGADETTPVDAAAVNVTATELATRPVTSTDATPATMETAGAIAEEPAKAEDASVESAAAGVTVAESAPSPVAATEEVVAASVGETRAEAALLGEAAEDKAETAAMVEPLAGSADLPGEAAPADAAPESMGSPGEAATADAMPDEMPGAASADPPPGSEPAETVPPSTEIVKPADEVGDAPSS